MPVLKEIELLLQAIGAVLPAAMGVALSPFPVIGIVVILAGPHGTRNGLLFAASWVVGLTLVAALVVWVFGGADDPESTSSAIADWLLVFVGAAIIVLAVRKWWTRPRPGDVLTMPSWMAALDDATAGKALVLGALLSGNPKNFVLTATAGTSMVEAGVHDSDLVAAVIVFVLLGSITVIGAVVVNLIGGRRGESLLESVRQFMVDNSTVIMVIILLILGANVLGNGLEGLGR